ncbi:DUF1214 domain-containing protein [Flavisolibacter tropicus]|uniref:DUF1254 domain-containing protein n=1 Tax=Flavisolibacter tropicus TaxID=1492898 RepID=A0A172TQB1_9BACT|nr:DUF1214 domain-containing protein [Flavisolibacter tropicus]ANE49220.1 hypothetical protein SY85_00580 [Flavisolibacter tropicus]
MKKILSPSVEESKSSALTDQDITDAYVYLLGRELVLKQQRLDFEKEGFKWNQIIHRELGGVAWANPNLDVAYSEAWVAVDENTCVVLEIPEIKGRYYTWQMLNGWGETLLNINERTFPDHPFGKFALCLKGSNPEIPQGCLRVDLPTKTSRVLCRVELGNDTKEAVRLQHLFKLTPQGEPKVEKPLSVPLFEGTNLPGAEIFQNASGKIQSEPDINEGMNALQEKTKAAEALVNSGAEGKARVDNVVKKTGIPKVFETIHNLGVARNRWTRPKSIGNYKDDYVVRTAVNYGGIWANNMGEVTYFTMAGNDGGSTYTLTFPKDALPAGKASYFWSIIAVDAEKFQVLPNPLNRFLLNKQSGLKNNPDGSLTLVFGPKPLTEYPESNWLPTIEGQKYNLTFRMYGPAKEVTDGTYFPPALVKK